MSSGLFAMLMSLCAASVLRAQDVQRFAPASGDGGFIGLDGTRTPGALRGSVHLFTDFALRPLDYDVAPGTRLRMRSRLMLHLGAELGLWGRGALAVHLPMIAYQYGGTSHARGEAFVPSDAQFSGRFRFLGASMADKDEPHDGPGLALQAGLGLPSGKHPRAPGILTNATLHELPYASDSWMRADVALLGDFQLLGAGVGGSLGYRHHFWDPKSIAARATSAANELTFGFGIKLPIPPVPKLAGVLELRGATGFRSARDTALELDLAGRLSVGAFVIVLGGGLGFTRGLGVPDGRLMLGVYGVITETDSDQDGVEDSVDACVYLAEDVDGFEDADGCPDPDNDGDLVPDLDDKCPNQAAEEDRDADEDGCTDPAPAAPAQ